MQFFDMDDVQDNAVEATGVPYASLHSFAVLATSSDCRVGYLAMGSRIVAGLQTFGKELNAACERFILA